MTEQPKIRVLFVCVHNAGRSQMAAAFFNAMAGSRALAASAGTQPAAGIHPAVAAAMREVNIDIVGNQPRLLTNELAQEAERLITMGCAVDAEACPAVRFSRFPIEDWGLPDPAGQPIERVRQIRELVRGKVAALLRDMGVEPYFPHANGVCVLDQYTQFK